MLIGHWAWQRERAEHHVGAVRSYARDQDWELDAPRGPDESPRGPCSRCAAAVAAAAAAAADTTSLYQSCSSSTDDDVDDDDDWETAEVPVYRPRTDRPCILTGTVYHMDVNHAETRGTSSPLPEFGAGDANANCPPDFVMVQNFKHQIALCITMQEGVLPKLSGGSKSNL